MTEQIYKGKKVAFCTLGCKLNFSETSTISHKFEDLGFEKVGFKEIADVYVINSCSVTAESDKKSRNIIRSAVKRNPDSLVIVTGCYAQLNSKEIAEIDGVDVILGSGEKDKITECLEDLSKKKDKVINVAGYKDIKKYFSA